MTRISLAQLERERLTDILSTRYAEAIASIPEYADLPPDIIRHAAFQSARFAVSNFLPSLADRNDIVEQVAAALAYESSFRPPSPLPITSAEPADESGETG